MLGLLKAILTGTVFEVSRQLPAIVGRCLTFYFLSAIHLSILKPT
jgi:hypothetical protein